MGRLECLLGGGGVVGSSPDPAVRSQNSGALSTSPNTEAPAVFLDPAVGVDALGGGEDAGPGLLKG